MTTSFNLGQALEIADPEASVAEIKRIAAATLEQADPDARIVSTENFNHTYLPDFVIEWSRTNRRFVYLRATEFAEEIADDVSILADRKPIFLHLGSLHSYNADDEFSAIGSLEGRAAESRTLVTSLPAVGEFFNPELRQTGRLLSSYVVREGKGLVEGHEAATAAKSVEAGFSGALKADNSTTADALRTVDHMLEVAAATRFKRLLEVAWISSGASPLDFPGGVASIGDAIPAGLLSQLLAAVPAESEMFWSQLGNSINFDTLLGLNLVGNQPQLQQIMSTAISKLYAKKCTVRRTARIDQKDDSFYWQLESGVLSLRGGGYQSWISGPSGVAAANREGNEIERPPTFSKVSTRAANAGISLTEVDMAGDLLSVRFSTTSGEDLSVVVHDSQFSVASNATVNKAVALVEGKSLEVRFADAATTLRTSATASVRALLWSSWCLLADSLTESAREGLRDSLAMDEELTEFELHDEDDYADDDSFTDFDEDRADEERHATRERELGNDDE